MTETQRMDMFVNAINYWRENVYQATFEEWLWTEYSAFFEFHYESGLFKQKFTDLEKEILFILRWS